MSQSSLQTSFVVKAPEVEIAILLEAIAAIESVDAGNEPEISDALHAALLLEDHDPEDRLQAVREIHDSTGGVPLMVSTERDGGDDEISIYGMENAEVAALGEVIRLTCPSALPMSFSYSYNASKPIEGAFGGGLVMITKDGVDLENTSTMADQFDTETSQDEPLSDLMKEGLAAYDGEHGDVAAMTDGLGYNAIKRMAFEGRLGDYLAMFVLTELHDAGDDAGEAADMMRRAAEQLEDVAAAMDSIAERRNQGPQA
jgi:hypothetical protein